jgi:hypothetical protein
MEPWCMCHSARASSGSSVRLPPLTVAMTAMFTCMPRGWGSLGWLLNTQTPHAHRDRIAASTGTRLTAASACTQSHMRHALAAMCTRQSMLCTHSSCLWLWICSQKGPTSAIAQKSTLLRIASQPTGTRGSHRWPCPLLGCPPAAPTSAPSHPEAGGAARAAAGCWALADSAAVAAIMSATCCLLLSAGQLPSLLPSLLGTAAEQSVVSRRSRGSSFDPESFRPSGRSSAPCQSTVSCLLYRFWRCRLSCVSAVAQPQAASGSANAVTAAAAAAAPADR